MPIVQITLIEGRSEEQKRDMYQRVCDAIHESTNSPRESIRIIIQELPNTDFAISGIMAKDLGR